MLKLFWIFFKIGASTFGGGYAMLPIIERELVEKNKLIKSEEFVDFISISQSFPGPIAVNISVIIGHRLMGFVGSVLALLGAILPSFLSIVIIGFFYSKFRNSEIVHGFFTGVNAVVPALLAISFISVFKKIDRKYRFYFLFILSFALIYIFNFNALLVIIGGGFIGLCTNFLKSI